MKGKPKREYQDLLAKVVAESAQEALVKQQELRKKAVTLKRKRGAFLSDLFFKALVRNPKFWGSFITIPDKELYIFTRQLSLMLGSGLSYLRAFKILFQQAEHPKIKYLCYNVLLGLEKGKRLSELLKEFEEDLGGYYIGVVAAGERTGQIDYVLRVLADQLEKHINLKKKVQSALVYPILVTLFGIGIVFFIFRFILPNIFSMLKTSGIKLPFYTVMFMHFSEFLQNPINLVYLFLFLVILFVIIKLVLSTPAGRIFWDNFKMRMPVYGKLTRLFLSLTFLRIFALVYEAGLPLLTSLHIAKRATNSRIMDMLVDWAIMRLKEGVRFSDIFGFHPYKANPQTQLSSEEKFMLSLVEDIFPSMARSLIYIGDHAGDLVTPIRKYVEFAEEETYRILENISSIIEPILILIIGVLVGVILLSVMVPLYSMIQGFS